MRHDDHVFSSVDFWLDYCSYRCDIGLQVLDSGRLLDGGEGDCVAGVAMFIQLFGDCVEDGWWVPGARGEDDGGLRHRGIYVY